MRPSDAKYSPGPWRVTNYWPRKIYDKVSRLVAVPFLPNTGDRTENCNRCDANADLISAAPELLECLKEAVIELCGNHIHGDEEGDCDCLVREDWRCTYNPGKCFVQRWLAAIRKAEGLK